MLLLIGAVALGFLVARLGFLPQFIQKRMGQISTFALFLLLFSMGIAMGSNPEIIANLPKLGGKALVLSISAIIGSVLFVWLGVRFSSKNRTETLGGTE